MRKERQLSEMRKKRYIPYMENTKAKACYAEESTEYWGKISVPPFSVRALTFEEIQKIQKGQMGKEWLQAEGNTVETPFYKIILSENGGGIRQIYDKGMKRNLLDDRGSWSFFELVRETVDAEDKGKGRKAIFSDGRWNRDWKANRAGSREDSVWNMEFGANSIIFRSRPSVEGASFAEQTITFYGDQEEIDLGLKINKDAVWDPERLYLVFPFFLKKGWECVYNTAGQFVKLDEQQIGSTCRDYVTVENGIALYDGEICYGLACPHAPMIQVGGFHFGREMRHIERRDNPILAAWPMNNYWETNFAPYQRDTVEFRYQLKVCRQPDQWQLYKDFVKSENRGLIGAVARMEKLLSAGFKKEFNVSTGKEELGIVKRLIGCSPEGALTNLYPARVDGMIAVLKNHGTDCQTVTVCLPESGCFQVYETDVQEKIRQQISVRDGKVNIELKPYEWKFLYLAQ